MMRGVAARARADAGRRAAALMLVGTMAAALGACGSADAPRPTPTVVASTSASPAPSPTPTETAPAEPTMPPEMERDDEVGAVAAAEYFMALWSYTVASGDLSKWDAISSEGCEFCARVRDDVLRVYNGGGTYQGGQLEQASAVAGRQSATLGGFPVTVTYSVGSGAEVDSTGSTVRQLAPESASVVIDTVQTSRGWALVELSIDAKHSVYSG